MKLRVNVFTSSGIKGCIWYEKEDTIKVIPEPKIKGNGGFI